MARNKALSKVLTIVMVLVILVAPLLQLDAQLSTNNHVAQEAASSIQADSAALVVPAVLACEGCSGGGSGPG